MKKGLFLLLLTILFISGATYAQLVGPNIYLPGHWLEIGQTAWGSLGTNISSAASPPPAGYFPTGGFTGIASVYDYGHDGWTVGAPARYGDYTLPGGPFEGWAIQVGTGVNWAFTGNTGITNPGTSANLAGSNTAYSNAAASLAGTWTGTAGPAGALSINMETRIDTNASWVVFTVKFKNTSAAALTNIYYMRTCDPDNDEVTSGNFATNNSVVYQNDADHRVMVKATGQTTTAAYLGLGTKDCRAKALIYTGWPLDSYASDLATVYNQTAPITPAQYNVGNLNGDIAIGLVYNIGSLAAGASTSISYSYTYLNSPAAIDSALPDPLLVVNGVNIAPVGPAPDSTVDTFNVCLYPGMTTLPVTIKYGTTGDWTGSTWTWSPATGLATTTGVTNSVNVNTIPPTITYTITGTNPDFCAKRTMYLTVKTCNNAVANTPCLGDTLKFNAPGDSTNATYLWYGPAPSTAVVATTQAFFKYPSVWADTGTYHVVKTVGIVSDTSSVVVSINPNPAILPANSTLCNGGTETLTATPPGGTWVSSSPSIAIIDPVTGIVTGESVGTSNITFTIAATGCKSSTGLTIVNLTPITGDTTLCMNLTTTLSNSSTGGTWISSNTAVAAVNITTGVVTGISGGNAMVTYTVPGGCYTTINVIVYPVAPITGTFALCQRRDSTQLNDAVTGGVWSTGNSSIATVTTTGEVYGGPTMAGGVAVIKYTTPHACISTVSVTVHGTPAAPGVTPKYYCQLGPTLQLVQASGAGPTFTWYGPGVTTGYSPGATPLSTLAGIDTYYVTQTSTFGCTSDSATQLVTIKPKPAPPTTITAQYCQNSVPSSLDSQVSNYTGTLNWFTNAGTLLSSEPVIPTGTPTFPDSLTWYVSQTVTNVIACKSDSVLIAVKIIPTPYFTINTRPWICQGDSMALGYVGPKLIFGGYNWSIPAGDVYVDATTSADSFIYVQFDSAHLHNIVYLTANNLYGACTTTQSVDIEVVPTPNAYAFSKATVCMSDTVALALSSRSANSLNYVWFIDDDPLAYSPAATIIASSSDNGGPYSISWVDTGRHIIHVQAFAAHGCAGIPTADTVQVNPLPDATFRISTHNSTLCLEDTVLFSANDSTFTNSYLWTPAHYFTANDKHAEWGRVEQTKSIVTLTVTDPFGCIASSSRELDPTACCSVPFPTAFTPNGDGLNDVFRPVPNGVYHVFHSFRVENRWGQVIFTSTDNRAEWDGTLNGVPQDLGVYFWYLEYDCNGETVQAKGDVTLIR